MKITQRLALSLQSIRNLFVGDNLRHRAMRASLWSISGHLTNQVIRLGSNLILTRILFPEAFGIMAIVQAVLIGVALLTDVGIEPAIIRSKRGNDPIFLNTAWTIQVIQGGLIWLLVCLLSPVLADAYTQPMLSSLLPVAGFGAVLGGLASTKLAVASRVLSIKTRVIVEVGAYALGVLATIVLAWTSKSIWSLVWGSLIGASAKTLASHLMTAGPKNKFQWDQDSIKALFSFGQWVVVSSALTFLAGEGNKLLLGAFLGVKLLAIYNLASNMSLVFWQIAQQLSSRVLYPAYSELVRDRPERLRAVAARSRLALIIPSWLISVFFVFWGDQIMSFLYDQRYAESGPILQTLAMGSLVGIVGGSYNGLLWAKGLVRTSTVLLGFQIAIQVVGIFIGHHFGGENGVILSVAFASWLHYPIQAFAHAKIGLWHPWIDFPIIVASMLVVWVAYSKV